MKERPKREILQSTVKFCNESNLATISQLAVGPNLDMVTFKDTNTMEIYVAAFDKDGCKGIAKLKSTAVLNL